MLDIMLPQLDGWQVCREIRKNLRCRLLCLPPRARCLTRCWAWKLGADDYIVKPFETKEVVARIKAVLRRTGQNQGEAVKEVKYDKLSINLTNYELKVNGCRWILRRRRWS